MISGLCRFMHMRQCSDMSVWYWCSGQQHSARVIEPVRMIIWKDKKKGTKVFKVQTSLVFAHFVVWSVWPCVCSPVIGSRVVSVLEMFSVLWRCWLGGMKGIRSVKNWALRCWHGYLSGARCRLAYGPVMPLPLTVSCFSKIQIGFTYLSGTGSLG